MKPIIQWLSEIEYPEVRERAVRNCIEEQKHVTVASQDMAVKAGFTWSETPEGIEYWIDISFMLSK